MNAGTVGERAPATKESRPAGQGFSRELARAEKRSRPDRPGGAVRRTGTGNEAAVAQRLASARSAPREALLRRRGEADAKNDRLVERREVAHANQLEIERSLVSPQAEVRAEPAAAASLAAAVERLELALERQRRAEGPSLEMQFGARLRIRLTRGLSGLELAISGDAAAARLARAELPDLLARLRQRGLAVSRAEVRDAPAAGNRGQPSPVYAR